MNGNREKNKSKDGDSIVEHVTKILQENWININAYGILQVDANGTIFKVTETLKKEDTNVQGMSSLVHHVTPAAQKCSCGKWQEYLYPCKHSLAFYKLVKGKSLEWIMQTKVNKMWHYSNVKDIYKHNIIPVIVDTVKMDGVTKPPFVKRQPGRPKQKRYERPEGGAQAKKRKTAQPQQEEYLELEQQFASNENSQAWV